MARGGPQAPARLNANVMMVKSAVHLSSVQNSAVIIRSKNAGNAALNVPRKKVKYLKRTSEDFSNIPEDYRLSEIDEHHRRFPKILRSVSNISKDDRELSNALLAFFGE